MKPLASLLLLLLLSTSCLYHPPGLPEGKNGPYIDSTGYNALQARIKSLEQTSDDSLIAQALAVQNDTGQTTRQSAFFASLEESYQRYLKLFSPVKRTDRPEIQCDCNLVETFNRQVFDPQPFLNAMLHTMSLTEVTTLEFRVEPTNSDTTLLYILLTKTEPNKQAKGFSVSEDDVILALTGKRAVLMTPVP
jgi:hypothetical protein